MTQTTIGAVREVVGGISGMQAALEEDDSGD